MPVIPALWEAEVGESQGQEFKTSLANMVSTKNTKNEPGVVVGTCNPATQEAVQGADIAVRLSPATASSPGDKTKTPSQRNKSAATTVSLVFAKTKSKN